LQTAARHAQENAQETEAIWLDPRDRLPSENEAHVAKLLNWRVGKLILHPESQ
jgi:hypothetical protein